LKFPDTVAALRCFFEVSMTKGTASPVIQSSSNTWRELFEAALMEHNRELLPHRLSDAKDAVMDRIEDSFDTASLSERRLLLAALNTIGELQRLANVDTLPRSGAFAQFGHAA
jgi:hypothetical protein